VRQNSRFSVNSLSYRSAILLGMVLVSPKFTGAAETAWSLSAEDRERALIALKKQWSRDQGSTDTAIELSSLMFLQGRREEASRTLIATHAQTSKERDRFRLEQKVRVISRSFITASGAREYQGAVNALLAGNLKPALARLETVLDSEHQVFDALVRKGQVEALLGRYDSAAETLRLANQINPFESELKIWLGHVLLVRGEKVDGVQEIFSAWRMSGSEQKERPHWRAWMAQALIASGRSGAARRLIWSTALEDSSKWTPESGWLIWGLARVEPSAKVLEKRFLNLFPGGYQRQVGSSGLDLSWWDPKVFDAERQGAEIKTENPEKSR